MCGIIGVTGTGPAIPRLIESLKRLEYRGYDSAGVAALVEGRIERRRAKGKIAALEAVLQAEPLSSTVGIGHTRWATHGAPTTQNAHPHKAGRVTLVHNGIIENFADLKAELEAFGNTFESQTDTEVVAHLLDRALGGGNDPVVAFKSVLDRLTGAYALAVLIEGEDGMILGARRGSPLVVGWGEGEMYLGSDALAVGPFTQTISYLEEGDYVALDRTGARMFDVDGEPVERQKVIVSASAAQVEKGEYRHFMEKEIHEQPDSVQRTLSAYLDFVNGRAFKQDVDFKSIARIQIVACGTAFYAAQIGRYAFEKLAGLPCDVEIASEFRYRSPALMPDTLAVAVSQSGETADTLACLTWCKGLGLPTAALVNVHTSSMAREAQYLWPTHAGPEIGVASTKALTAQVAALLALAVTAGVARGRISADEEARLVQALFESPRLIAEALQMEDRMRDVAHELSRATDVLFLGRGAMFPLAMEGALKLKEISYIHAEGYAAGELKHGPIALIDEDTPTVALAPLDDLFEKTASNLQEIAARGGPVVMIAPLSAPTPHGTGITRIEAPDCHPLIAPLVYAIPVQMLAYFTAVHKGTDVDQPRNLAKSVTVE
ncbi:MULTISPECIES: glutamine--fructose-6-phosphate transaminase (isomerizing) [unclassified Brevundimonas]|jgi:glucosamine--fructose-6-phosphate aminotransferase (isomerizing)|uniref:glutamine--fructose-6-phosphate transaminase (isomerizing) n=1 Tax=unclassified Brevundimonas TaxID=2622653 RepID=UPI000C611858|nr:MULTISPECIES: glutamine--fructose-6-phosphate transaminase (isomerizing) [unclassified Brevundimonas]MAL89632.1 glutamine--fructose-6-phosphate transaminase (isomerizing) [Brevundimonas sp.]HAJ02209.1 glutamine--fructose-6-phosphate transaminase (isomerizing) [Brevundimonas sp.]|tara:strand:- start:4385 stop:6199 length:1815 start_codon:yes stop_codon:yes gene_type:complete